MYHSQSNQDRYLNENYFNGKRCGFFVDVGAHDGVSISNTLFFERELGWKGICIEPIPDIFKSLSENRISLCINACAYNRNTVVEFKHISGYSEMLSGIVSSYNPLHNRRISNELSIHGGSENTISVDAVRLD